MLIFCIEAVKESFNNISCVSYILMNSIFMNTNKNRLDYNFIRVNIVLHKIVCFKEIVFYCKMTSIVWMASLLLEGPGENIWDY